MKTDNVTYFNIDYRGRIETFFNDVKVRAKMVKDLGPKYKISIDIHKGEVSARGKKGTMRWSIKDLLDALEAKV